MFIVKLNLTIFHPYFCKNFAKKKLIQFKKNIEAYDKGNSVSFDNLYFTGSEEYHGSFAWNDCHSYWISPSRVIKEGKALLNSCINFHETFALIHCFQF